MNISTSANDTAPVSAPIPAAANVTSAGNATAGNTTVTTGNVTTGGNVTTVVGGNMTTTVNVTTTNVTANISEMNNQAYEMNGPLWRPPVNETAEEEVEEELPGANITTF
jgi:hypothetical protein